MGANVTLRVYPGVDRIINDEIYEAWDPISCDREHFREWMERHVIGTEDFGEYLEGIRQEEVIKG